MTANQMIDPSMSNDQIYDVLEARLKLYTGLWFATLTDAHNNLQFTAILCEIFKTKTLMDMVLCLRKY